MQLNVWTRETIIKWGHCEHFTWTGLSQYVRIDIIFFLSRISAGKRSEFESSVKVSANRFELLWNERKRSKTRKERERERIYEIVWLLLITLDDYAWWQKNGTREEKKTQRIRKKARNIKTITKKMRKMKEKYELNQYKLGKKNTRKIWENENSNRREKKIKSGKKTFK